MTAVSEKRQRRLRRLEPYSHKPFSLQEALDLHRSQLQARLGRIQVWAARRELDFRVRPDGVEFWGEVYGDYEDLTYEVIDRLIAGTEYPLRLDGPASTAA